MTVVTAAHARAAARILLVDDNKSGLAARKSVLEELGYRVATASGADDGLECFSNSEFDLVVTDYRMPKMDGVEFIRKIRTIHPEIPIIMLSGYVEAAGLTESNTGADLVILKSANEVTHLVRSVSRLLRRKPARKPPVSHKSPPKVKRAGA